MPVPEFVLSLRRRVGTAPLWLSGVSAVVLDENDRILLTRRRDNGLWAVVSGILEPGEEPGPAALREIAEETGLDAELIRLTSVDVTGPITYPNGDQAQYLDLTFLARRTGGDAHVADDENLAVEWFAPDALPETLLETSRLRIDKALDDSVEAWFRN
ncbi:NUDIX domain-containing protein [Rhodococcus sp. PAMC28707]|uniref:NUDIX hydrolase n=1 Tax=unclassified Rhodococcus (in: high G+C Gram-positive bacteria) TaxID=192944 RepID=UPI00109DFBCD|nr:MULTISPECIES: NUDIX domain-containing protein [unclassified Rhodococcus (in: high G+C Gram-positive bacteria)]QCB50755.1 NUDIX domain-containing protein [Rhodococcus sp. PAMC28705]QCB57553.1 NUDIX domain-containing protein [Rhodococcus sp. PAMC28707]